MRRALLVGLVVFAASSAVAATEDVPGAEEAVFEVVNGLPSGIEWLVWVPMQLGAVLAVPAVALAGWLAWRRWRAAAQLLAAGLVAWVLAKPLKAMAGRGRPATYLDDVELRGGSVGGGHNEGLGFPSGHATIAFALATVAAYWLPSRWRWLPFALAVVVGLGRMYFGAHLPLDVVGGSALGLLLGWGAHRLLGGGDGLTRARVSRPPAATSTAGARRGR